MIPDVPCRFTIRPLAEDEGGGNLIDFPDLPGCMSDGATIEDGLDAMPGWTPAMRAESHPIPAPTRCGGIGRRPIVCHRSRCNAGVKGQGRAGL